MLNCPMIMFRFTLLTLFGVTCIALINGCVHLTQWEGWTDIKYISEMNDGSRINFRITGKMYSDEINNKIFYNQTVNGTINGKPEHFRQEILYEYNSKTKWYIKDGSCSKSHTNETGLFRIPDDARIVAHAFVGKGTARVATKVYKFMADDRLNYLTVLADKCVPYMAESSGPITGGNLTMHVRYLFVTRGISDPSVFGIQKYC